MSNPGDSGAKDISAAEIRASAEDLPKDSSRAARDEAAAYERSGHEWEYKQAALGLGAFGKLFGSKSAAPTNIAGFIAVTSLIAILVSAFSSDPETAEWRKMLIGLITSALSFIFGAASKK